MALYKEKVSQRETEDKASLFDYFGRAGAGAPMRGDDGRIITKRRTLLNNRYEEIALNQSNGYNKQKVPYEPQELALPPKQHLMSDLIKEPDKLNDSGLLPQYEPNVGTVMINPYYYPPYMPYPYYPSLNRSQSYQLLPINSGLPISPYTVPIQIPQPYPYSPDLLLNARSPSSQMPNLKANYSLSQRGSNRPLHQSMDESVEIKKRMLREDWLNQIEDKKRRIEEQKAKQIREEQAEEAKWTLYMEKQKAKEKSDSIKKITKAFPPQLEQTGSFKDTTLSKQKPPYSEAEQTFRLLNMKKDKDALQYNRFTNSTRNSGDLLQEEINKLRFDISNQYVHMTNMYGRLRNEVVEADQLKSQVMQEAATLKEDLTKSKLESLIYDNKLEGLVDRNRHYLNSNSIQTPINHFNENDLLGKKQNLKSTSDMIYSNDLSENSDRKMSNLAQAGQNLIGEAEFVPIQTQRVHTEEKETNEAFKEPVSTRQLGMSDSFRERAEVKGKKKANEEAEQEEFKKLFEKLDDIAQINHLMNPLNKFNTMRKNLEIDYGSITANKKLHKDLNAQDNPLHNYPNDSELHIKS